MFRPFFVLMSVIVATGAAAQEAANPVTIGYAEPLQLIRGQDEAAQKAMPDRRSLRFDAFGQRFDLTLRPNRSLSSSQQIVGESFVAWEGQLSGLPESWARISYLDGTPQGLIYDGSSLFAIEKHGGAEPVVFRVDDLHFADGALGCPVHVGEHTGKQLLEDLARKTQPTVARALGATQQIEVGVLADSEFAGNEGADARNEVLARMNTVDGIFSEQLELQFNVGSVEVFSGANDPFTEVTDAGDLLDEVRGFRANSSAQRAFGLTHLFTGRNLDGTTAGIAFLDVVCSGRFGVGLTQATFGPVTDALIAAHEFGHNFAAPHDGETDSVCESESTNFLMAPRVSNNPNFSPCSLQVISASIQGASCISSISLTEVALSSLPDPAAVLADTPINVVFSALNSGTENVTDVTVRAPVPSDLSIVSTSANVGSCAVSANTVECTAAALGSGEAMDVMLSVQASTGGSRTITATVTSPDDSNANNNDAQTVVFFTPAVDLDVRGGSATVQVDQSTSVSVSVDNLSDDIAEDVVVTLTPDAELTLSSASWSGAGACTVLNNVATCSTPTLIGGAQTQIDLEVVGTEAGVRSIAVEITTATTDVESANNASAATITVNAPAPGGTGGGSGGGAIGGDSGGGAMGWLLALFTGLLGIRTGRRSA